ncbi:hemolysin family protein [Patescibacteria group bacterium]
MVIILFLIIINGILAMAEIAIVASKKYKLEKKANDGNANAKIALNLANEPGKFLSSIQIGITFVGILAGALGEITITQTFSSILNSVGFLQIYSDGISRILVVLFIGFGFMIFGELVPKRIALHNPEMIALLISPFMQFISFVSAPIVHLLSTSTDFVLHLLNVKKTEESIVSEEEVKMLIKEGARIGVFELSEKNIVERTLKLGDKKVSALMIARKEVIWLKKDSSPETIIELFKKHPQSYFPVCNKSLDNIIGVVRAKALFLHLLTHKEKALKKSIEKPLIIPENMPALKALEMFKKTKMHMALIVDEYGSIQGLITLTDILEGIVGDIPSHTETEEDDVIKRDDGSWLVNGLMTVDEFKEYFHVKKTLHDKHTDIHTIAGFVVSHLGKVPTSGDHFDWNDYRFEVVDMDGNRVDKVLVVKIK